MKKIVVNESESEIDYRCINSESLKTILIYYKNHYGCLLKSMYLGKDNTTISVIYRMIVLDNSDYPWKPFESPRVNDVLKHFIEDGAEVYQFDTFTEGVKWLNDRLQLTYNSGLKYQSSVADGKIQFRASDRKPR